MMLLNAVKPMYAVVNQKRGKTISICYTRDEAREVKAMAGGKEKGVAIIKFVPIYECR